MYQFSKVGKGGFDNKSKNIKSKLKPEELIDLFPSLTVEKIREVMKSNV